MEFFVLRTDNFFFFVVDSSADPLLDEHFRRSLGADYESLFKKKTGSESEPPSSTESTPPKVPQQQSSSDQSPKVQEDSTKVDDPVKAFQEDMEMEGYTGKKMTMISAELIYSNFSFASLQLKITLPKLWATLGSNCKRLKKRKGAVRKSLIKPKQRNQRSSKRHPEFI